MKNECLSTKWGRAKINSKGYYVITSRTECNVNKHLHRLIFEDFYKMTIPKGYVIHHKNGNKLDNCVLNLQLLRRSQHQSIHMRNNHPMKNKHHTDEAKRKISEAGKQRIVSDETKQKISNFHKGRKRSLETREKISNALKGRKLSEEHKMKLSESHKGHVLPKEQRELMSKSISRATSTTGIYRVSKKKHKLVKQGFVYNYSYIEEGKRKQIVSVNLKKLEEKVKSKGLPWIIFEDKLERGYDDG